MKWDAISFDWNQVRAFLATCETGSFSAAARALGSTQPTISRQVDGLEHALSVTCFERSGRRLRLTETGKRLHEHVREMGQAAALVSMAAAGQSRVLAGSVTISASDLISLHNLPPIIAQIRADAPEIELTVISQNALSDLTLRDADIAIRHVRPESGDLIARHVCDMSARFYASKAYLNRVEARRGELRDDVIIGIGDISRLIAICAEQGVHLNETQFGLRCTSGPTVLAMIEAGIGIGLLPDDLAASRPDLVPVLEAVGPIPFPVWLVTHRELQTSERMRFVFEALADGLKGAPRAAVLKSESVKPL